MDTVGLLGTALGIGFLSGIRLYATVLGLGLAIHFHLLTLTAQMSQLQILADWRVLTASGVAFLLEFFADKIPWVDSVWDVIHTFIRPVGGALLGAAALGHIDPALKVILVILCGGVALTGHSAKAATRLLANHSPEPVSNIALSVAEDALVPAGLWIAVSHPLVALILVILAVGFIAWITPKIFRLIAGMWKSVIRWVSGAPELARP